MTRIVFLDTETTGLYPEAGHEVWDIGMIVREPGQPDRGIYTSGGDFAKDPEIHELTEPFCAFVWGGG